MRATTRLLRAALRHPRSMLAALLGGAAIATAVLAIGVSGSAATAAARVNAAASSGEGGLLVQTDKGPVRGFVKNGVTEFLGIPYAAPPVGALRWRPPQPHASWTQPLNATHYGPTCPQNDESGVFAGPTSVSENCLYLNIFTTKTGHLGSSARPVLVWIPGGGNTSGESNDYDGSKLAMGGSYGGSDTVVVTINYRLGLLGFLANPALDSEGHPFADYGIMDQQAALRWVQQNIAAFGGNPHNVTLAGQSAGAADTDANVISPLSKGLFDRAISESAVKGTFDPLSDALARGEAFAKAAGCTGSNTAVATCLRSLSVAQILQLEGNSTASSSYVIPNEVIVDGTVIPEQPETAWATGKFNHMPMMGGHTKDEADFDIGITEYNSGPTPQKPMTAAQYVTDVTNTFSPPTYPAGTAAKVLAEYPLSNYPSPQLAYDAVSTDSGAHGGGCVGLYIDNLVAKQVPFYGYEFDYQHAPYYFPSMPGFVPLAPHTIDIQFLFPLYHGGPFGVAHPLNAQQTTLSNELVAAWTNFANVGNPNGTGNSPWPRFTSGVGPYLSENIPNLSTLTDSQYSAEHNCSFWDPILGY